MGMARQPRIQLPGGVYHVFSRGHHRNTIFFDDSDFLAFLGQFAAAWRKFGVFVHAYAFLSNHFHLLLQTPTACLSRAMHWLNGVYGQYFNARYEKWGYVFQGRYNAILVDSGAYFLALSRYIHRNPVEAGLSRDAWSHRWSSAPVYAGLAPKPAWLELNRTLGYFKRFPLGPTRGYMDFVGQPPLAGDGFTALPWPEDLAHSAHLPEFPVSDASVDPSAEASARPSQAEIRRVWAQHLDGAILGRCHQGRRNSESDALAFLLHEAGGFKLAEVGKSLGIGESATSKAVSRFKAMLAGDGRWRERIGAALCELGETGDLSSFQDTAL